MKERRKSDRLNIKWKLTYSVLQNNQFIQAPQSQSILDISSGGVSFMTEQVIVSNTIVAVELEPDSLSSSIWAFAKVVRCQRKDWGYQIGAKFWWKNNTAQPAISDYVESQGTKPVEMENLNVLLSSYSYDHYDYTRCP